MSEQDINAPFYQFCLTGEGDIAALQASIFQREGGCHGLHDFIFNNKELPALREHFLAQFKRRVNTNSLLRRFMEQFANELGFDNFSDYFDAQQARFPSQSLVYSFTLGLGTDQEHAGIGKRVRNANRPVLRQPSNATAATLGAPAPNANNTHSWRSVFSTPVQTHPSGSVSGTPFGSFGMQPNYDKEESNLDSHIDKIDDRLVTVETEHEERMRLIQEEEDEVVRKVKAKHNETRRRVELEQAKMKRELEAEKEGCQRDKARNKEEKENNLTLPKANLLAIKTAYDLVQLYHMQRVEQDGNPDLQTMINTNLSILQRLQNGIAKKSLDELKPLVWDDDDL